MKKRILILVDAQNDFCGENGSLSNKETVGTVKNIVELLKTKKFDRILVTMDTHNRETYSATQEGQLIPIDHCIEGTDGFKLHPDIENALNAWLENEIPDYTSLNKTTRYFKTLYKHAFVSPLDLNREIHFCNWRTKF